MHLPLDLCLKLGHTTCGIQIKMKAVCLMQEAAERVSSTTRTCVFAEVIGGKGRTELGLTRGLVLTVN